MREDEIKEWISHNLLTKQEVMDQFKISSVNFDNYVRRSKFEPFIKKGSKINLYLKREVENFLENTTSNQTSTIKVNRKNQVKNENKNYKNFLNQSVTFSELVKEIQSYVRLNFADPKGEHSEKTKKLIRANGFNNPDDFLNEYIYK